jgi:hypothetical protein
MAVHVQVVAINSVKILDKGGAALELGMQGVEAGVDDVGAGAGAGGGVVDVLGGRGGGEGAMGEAR